MDQGVGMCAPIGYSTTTRLRLRAISTWRPWREKLLSNATNLYNDEEAQYLDLLLEAGSLQAEWTLFELACNASHR